VPVSQYVSTCTTQCTVVLVRRTAPLVEVCCVALTLSPQRSFNTSTVYVNMSNLVLEFELASDEEEKGDDNEKNLVQTSKRQKTSTRIEDSEERKPPPKREDGGFVIHCKDQHVFITATQAAALQKSCDYFRNAFRHGTKESISGILSKPDWTRETCRCLVALLIDGRCEVPSGESLKTASTGYRGLQEAAAQILVPLRVIHPMNDSNISSNTSLVALLSKRWKARKSEFVLESPVFTKSGGEATTKWHGLFQAGVVVLRNKKDGLIVEMGGATKVEDYDSDPAKDKTGLVFSVGATTPLCVAAFHACYYLSGFTKSPQSEDNPGSFRLDFQVNFGGGLYLKHLLEVNVSSLRSNSLEMVSLAGSLDDLLRSVDLVEDFVIPSDESKLCMLKITNPSSLVLGKFIGASQQCKSHPATLGWKSDDNSFYAVKNIEEIRTMLAFLSDPSTKAATAGPFHLRDHALSRRWEAF